jgi:hypothetical protein
MSSNQFGWVAEFDPALNAGRTHKDVFKAAVRVFASVANAVCGKQLLPDTYSDEQVRYTRRRPGGNVWEARYHARCSSLTRVWQHLEAWLTYNKDHNDDAKQLLVCRSGVGIGWFFLFEELLLMDVGQNVGVVHVPPRPTHVVEQLAQSFVRSFADRVLCVERHYAPLLPLLPKFVRITLSETCCPFGLAEDHKRVCSYVDVTLDREALFTMVCTACGESNTGPLKRAHSDTYDFLAHFWGEGPCTEAFNAHFVQLAGHGGDIVQEMVVEEHGMRKRAFEFRKKPAWKAFLAGQKYVFIRSR